MSNILTLRLLCGCAAVGLVGQPFAEARAESDIQPSFRLNAWSSNRLNDSDVGIVSGEIWGRARSTVSPNLSVKAEGWIATDPVAQGKAGGDIREASATLALGEIKLTAGRQLLSWGRADRINPTDVVSPRDLRRLVEEEEDNRLGIGAISLSAPLVGGTVTAHWLPEFRASKLPQDLAGDGLAVLQRARVKSENDFAIRYERFGSKVDVALTYANVTERLPWLTLTLAPNGRPALQAVHPRMQMFGADMATTIGNYGIRAEVAAYTDESGEINQFSAGRTRFAGVVGVDRSFAGQWSIILQGVLRVNDRATVLGRNAAVADRNAQIHAAWKPLIIGGFARVKKGFSGDRASAEIVGAMLSGGGYFGQIKMAYTIRDGVKLNFLGERFGGKQESFLGRQKRNSLIMLGLKAGF